MSDKILHNPEAEGKKAMHGKAVQSESRLFVPAADVRYLAKWEGIRCRAVMRSSSMALRKLMHTFDDGRGSQGRRTVPL